MKNFFEMLFATKRGLYLMITALLFINIGVVGFGYQVYKTNNELKERVAKSEDILAKMLKGELPLIKVGDKLVPVIPTIINEIKNIEDVIDKTSASPTPRPNRFQVNP